MSSQTRASEHLSSRLPYPASAFYILIDAGYTTHQVDRCLLVSVLLRFILHSYGALRLFSRLQPFADGSDPAFREEYTAGLTDGGLL